MFDNFYGISPFSHSSPQLPRYFSLCGWTKDAAQFDWSPHCLWDLEAAASVSIFKFETETDFSDADLDSRVLLVVSWWTWIDKGTVTACRGMQSKFLIWGSSLPTWQHPKLHQRLPNPIKLSNSFPRDRPLCHTYGPRLCYLDFSWEALTTPIQLSTKPAHFSYGQTTFCTISWNLASISIYTRILRKRIGRADWNALYVCAELHIWFVRPPVPGKVSIYSPAHRIQIL